VWPREQSAKLSIGALRHDSGDHKASPPRRRRGKDRPTHRPATVPVAALKNDDQVDDDLLRRVTE
jgi:hypothetical protein